MLKRVNVSVVKIEIPNPRFRATLIELSAGGIIPHFLPKLVIFSQSIFDSFNEFTTF
jgi:hypothetical protein